MLFFTLSDHKNGASKSMPMENGQYLVETEYSEADASRFLAEAARWCVKTCLNYYQEDYAYHNVERWNKTEYFPISQREIVIDNGCVIGFIRHLGCMSRSCRTEQIALLYTDAAKQTILRNVIDSHCSENYDCDIYYTYQLILRELLPEGEFVAPERNELHMVNY